MASLLLNSIHTSQKKFHPKKQKSRPLKITQTQFTNLQEKATQNPQTLYKSFFHHIQSLSKQCHIQQAIDCLSEMELENLRIGPEIYGEILQGCVYERALFTGKQIHARIVKNGEFYLRNEYIETKLVIFYAKCDDLETTLCLFRRLCVQNVFSWAAMIGLYVRIGNHENGLLGYVEMCENGFLPDNFVVPNALKACGALQCLGFGRGVHGYVIKMGYGDCVYVASSLVDFYGKCGVLEDAKNVFGEMPEKNVVVWNSMIVSYVQNGMNEDAIRVFCEMRVVGVEPTRVTIGSVLSASANLNAPEEGKQGHALAILSGLELDNILGSSILNFYSKVDLVQDAEMVFSRIVERDIVTWNLLISCYVRYGQLEKAFNACHLMRLEKLRFDSVTLASIMSASANTCDTKLGLEVHCYCIRNNFESDVVVASTIVDMYGKCDKIVHARRVFYSSKQKDLVLWNTIISAYAELGLSGESLKLFYQMQLEGVPPNIISWNSVILGFMRNGHVYEAEDMFSHMQMLGFQPNVITWTILISGLAQNGFGDEAILHFSQMQESGIKPNIVSITAALSACSHISSLKYGRFIHGYVTRHELFQSISVATSLVNMYAKWGSLYFAKTVFDMVLVKELPLYNAMISAYASHGQALEALKLFKHLDNENINPDNITFTSVLSACSHAGLVNEGLEIFVDLISKQTLKPSMEHYSCVVTLLSRSGNLDDALQLITMMPFNPDAQILGSLLAICKDRNEIELAEYLSSYLNILEPDNSGNYVNISNACAAAGKWDEVSKWRNLMKEKGLKKSPGCSWIQIEGETHVFVAGDRSHLYTEKICWILALVYKEMQFIGHASLNI